MFGRNHEERRHSNGMAWLATIIAIAALVVAWLAYNRSGKDLEDSVQDTTNSAIQEVQESASDAGEEAQEASDSAEGAIDTGPDGVDDGQN